MPSRMGVFRRKVALGRYELTGHAKDEMEQDGFSIGDVKSAVYSSRIVGVQHHGRGPRKYVVAGKAEDRRPLRLVCRLTATGQLRIITVFGV
ncbi:MAG: DUF4258 domain-containing protein [Planctomycetes bacterium]|nr:DUF4258 domain-containing protein [Planctomycetota bacterium]